MPSCVAFGCTNRTNKKKPGITFHKFPKIPELREVWVRACRRKNWTPSEWSTLCSLHFSEDQIDRSSLASVRIKENSVPNIFPAYPSYLQKMKKYIKAPAKRNIVSVPKEVTTSVSKIPMMKATDLSGDSFRKTKAEDISLLPVIKKNFYTKVDCSKLENGLKNLNPPKPAKVNKVEPITEDRYDIFGKYIASELRRITDNDLFLEVKDAIEDIVFNAQRKRKHSDSQDNFS